MACGRLISGLSSASHDQSQRRALTMARRKCVVCGSKQWHKEPSSGLVACSEGHILQVRCIGRILLSGRKLMHVNQNYRNETNEADDMNTTHVLRRRRLKTGREKKKARGGADPKRECSCIFLIRHRPVCCIALRTPSLNISIHVVYHGARGRYHYFQCQQLILRRQINELRALWDLPPEFEACFESKDP